MIDAEHYLGEIGILDELAVRRTGDARCLLSIRATLSGKATAAGRVLDPAPGMRQQVIEANQNQTLPRFERLRLNTDVPDSHFDVKIPAGVERVRG